MKDSDSALQLFISAGLTEQTARETLKNTTLVKFLIEAINEAKNNNISLGDYGLLLYHIASRIKTQISHFIPLIVKDIGPGKLDSNIKIDEALKYLLNHPNGNIDTVSYEKACGIGVTVSPEDIEKTVEEVLKKYKDELVSKRYRFNVGVILQEVRNRLKWADGKSLRCEVDLQILDILGPKTADDLVPIPKSDKKNKKVVSDSKQSSPSESVSAAINNEPLSMKELIKNKIHFHKPGENYKTDGYVITPKTMELLEKHLKETGGKVFTRFPPEPNGILHIGHAKAININFGYAEANGGECYLRYDDTNPEKEEAKFFDAIKEMVEWLGYKPSKITHSSDYFDNLYQFAEMLIESDLAYVCHQTPDEVKSINAPPSPWRNRPIEESKQLFKDMRNGKIDEGKATLRMKIMLEEGKQDPVAYRIKFLPHHRTADKWCIYPTYDFTHCLCDSLENITHSLCTKEFQSRRSSYYWLCNSLNIYCPVQWEYGRLNLNYTVVSKRKIAKLIETGIVKDWDDPRLFTLTALKRRGFPPEAINSFCAEMGLTGAVAVIDPQKLEASVRDYLNITAPRTMVVLDPVKVTITNFMEDKPIPVNVPYFPSNSNSEQYQILFDRVIYIEKTDFKEVSEKGYRRLTPDQPVGLRHTGFLISVSEIRRDESGNISELLVTCTKVADNNKPKAFIHWVSFPLEIEVRLYDTLFKHKNPEDVTQVPDGFLSDCNENTLLVKKSFADVSLKKAKVFDKFQFERIGFYSMDPDSTPDHMVFNQTVTLKEDPGKA